MTAIVHGHVFVSILEMKLCSERLLCFMLPCAMSIAPYNMTKIYEVMLDQERKESLILEELSWNRFLILTPMASVYTVLHILLLFSYKDQNY